MEKWRPIEGFNGYSISNLGRVRNDKFDKLLTLTRNQRGILIAGLMRDRVQHKRSVAVLVAGGYLDPHPMPRFDTPTHRDGDRMNCEANNLMWRPRWFSIAYHQQFTNNKRGYIVPIRDVETGRIFPTSWDAAMEFGLIDREIRLCIQNRTPVFPTGQLFQVLRN